MQANVTMAAKLLASLSYRVPSLRLSQPTEHPLDDVALPVFGAVEQAWQSRLGLALHVSQWDHRLHSVTVAVLAQVLGIVAFVCQQPAAALLRPILLALRQLKLAEDSR